MYELKKLKKNLIGCKKLLREVGEAFWADNMDLALSMIEQGRGGYAIEEIKSWYGGMGSFSDLQISEVNGHNVKYSQELRINRKLQAYRRRIYDEVDSIRG